MVEYIIALFGAVIAYFIGKFFPDLDLHEKLHFNPNLPWMVHRNFLFHSALIVFVLWLLTSPFDNPICFFVTTGAAIGLARHLLNDVFPLQSRGNFSRIHYTNKSLNPFWSRVWLVSNALLGFAIALQAA